MKIILVDDHSLFRRGLRSLLERIEGYEVVAEASSGEEFLEIIGDIEVDVVFMDFSMAGITGDVATERALSRYPDMRIITLSMFGDENYYRRMVEAGARGFLLKDSDIQEVHQAVEIVAAGGEYFSDKLLTGITTTDECATEEGPECDALSSREREILVAVCQGLSNVQIADKLFISKRTVDKHRANIMEKTGCKNTANLVVYAVKHNLVEF